MVFKLDHFVSLKIVFVLTNSVDPDKMLYYVVFYLGLHCLYKYLSIQMVKQGS